MRQVIKNRYLKVFGFLSSRETTTFLNNQGANENWFYTSVKGIFPGFTVDYDCNTSGIFTTNGY